MQVARLARGDEVVRVVGCAPDAAGVTSVLVVDVTAGEWCADGADGIGFHLAEVSVAGEHQGAARTPCPGAAR